MEHIRVHSISGRKGIFPVVALVLLLSLTIMLRELLLFTFLSVLFALAMSYPVKFFSRWMPRGVAVLLLLLLGAAAATGFALIIVPQLSEQFHSMTQRLPDAANSLQKWTQGLRREATQAGVSQASNFTNKIVESVSQGLESSLSSILPAAKGLAVAFATLFLMIVMAAFLVFQPETYRKGLRSLVPRDRAHTFDEYYLRLSESLRHWLGGILIAMTLMGLLTTVGLWVAGIDNWPLLGLLTFTATFIPYLGGIASAIPGLMLALSQSPRHFLYAMIVYLGVHLCEGYVVEPLVMKRVVSIPPATLLFGETALGLLFGLPGIIVAAPILVGLQVTIQFFYKERYLGTSAPRDVRAS